MAIRVDLSYLPADLKCIILNSIEVKPITDSQSNESTKDVITFINENDIQKIKQIMQNILRQNDVDDYLVTENSEKENEIAILKQGDMEQFGIYICVHCGTSFDSEIQRIVHQRMHYFT